MDLLLALSRFSFVLCGVCCLSPEAYVPYGVEFRWGLVPFFFFLPSELSLMSREFITQGPERPLRLRFINSLLACEASRDISSCLIWFLGRLHSNPPGSSGRMELCSSSSPAGRRGNR